MRVKELVAELYVFIEGLFISESFVMEYSDKASFSLGSLY